MVGGADGQGGDPGGRRGPAAVPLRSGTFGHVAEARTETIRVRRRQDPGGSMDEQARSGTTARGAGPCEALLSETVVAGREDRAAANQGGDMADPAERLTAEEGDDAVPPASGSGSRARTGRNSGSTSGTFGLSVRSGATDPRRAARGRPRGRAHRRGVEGDLRRSAGSAVSRPPCDGTRDRHDKEHPVTPDSEAHKIGPTVVGVDGIRCVGRRRPLGRRTGPHDRVPAGGHGRVAGVPLGHLRGTVVPVPDGLRPGGRHPFHGRPHRRGHW